MPRALLEISYTERNDSFGGCGFLIVLRISLFYRKRTEWGFSLTSCGLGGRSSEHGV